MPKIDIARAVVRTKGVYPQPYSKVTDGREKAALGNVAGLTQFGVNLTRLKPGARRCATGTSRRTSSSTCSKASSR